MKGKRQPGMAHAGGALHHVLMPKILGPSAGPKGGPEEGGPNRAQALSVRHMFAPAQSPTVGGRPRLAMKNARLALLLGVASSVTVVLLFPYLLVLIPKLGTTPIPLWLLVPIQAVQGGVQLFLAAWLGLYLGAPIGLDSPLLRAWVYRQPQSPDAPRPRFLLAVALGLGVGSALVIMDRFLFMPRQPEVIRNLGATIAQWKGLLASFYGGIGEEVLTRQFFMSLIAWLLFRVTRSRHTAVFVASAVVAAVAFAAAHLPAAAQLAPLDTWVVSRVLVLNSIAGVAFGLLFWRRGLEHAMVAHFCADLVLHVLAP